MNLLRSQYIDNMKVNREKKTSFQEEFPLIVKRNKVSIGKEVRIVRIVRKKLGKELVGVFWFFLIDIEV